MADPAPSGACASDAALLEIAAASIPREQIEELLRPNERGFRMPVRNGRPWFTDAMQCDACGTLVTATSAEAQRRGETLHRGECRG